MPLTPSFSKAQRSPIKAADSSDNSSSEKGVLVVDDDGDLRPLVVDALAAAGYRVYPAGSCAEGIEILETSRNFIHVVLTDFDMPGGNGDNLLGWMAENNVRIPFLMMSARTFDALRSAVGRVLTHDYYLKKPFTPEELEGKIKAVLNTSSGR